MFAHASTNPLCVFSDIHFHLQEARKIKSFVFSCHRHMICMNILNTKHLHLTECCFADTLGTKLLFFKLAMDCFMTILVSTLISEKLTSNIVYEVYEAEFEIEVWRFKFMFRKAYFVNEFFFFFNPPISTQHVMKVFILKHPQNAAMKSQWHNCALLSRLSLLMFVMITEPKSRMVSDMVARNRHLFVGIVCCNHIWSHINCVPCVILKINCIIVAQLKFPIFFFIFQL